MSSVYLMHYGVKGMKWGVRHDPEPKEKKTQSRYQRWLSDQYQVNYRVSKNDADKYAAERTKALKRILIGTAVVSAVLAGYTAFKYHKYVHADEVLKKGTQLQSLQADPSFILKGEKFYASHGKMSNQKYLARWSKMGTGTSEYKKKLTATVENDIRLAGRKNASRGYHSLRKTNPEFRSLTDKYSGYTDFNIHGLSGRTSRESHLYGEHMKKQGFGGVKDINDRHYGFNTQADIYFGNKNLGNYKISDINKESVRIANKRVNGELWLRAMSQPAVLIGGAEAGAVAGMARTDKKIKKKIYNKEV